MIKGDQAVVTVPVWKEELTGLVTSKVSEGDEVVISIRPEKIRLTDRPPSGLVSLEGVVATSTYIGSDTRVYLDVRGQRLKVWEQNHISTLDPRAYYRNGQSVWVSLLPENTLILPKD
jgi:ABC-type Fe3+/spermidine/putrescine transport system ATPase subunit